MSKLYTPRMLMLATQLASYPLDDGFEMTADARSALCGSTLAIGLDLDAAGAVSRIGLKVSACAVGQGSAAVLAGSVRGARLDDIVQTHAAILLWLDGEGDLPPWPQLDTLAGAREHRGRHGALLLPWDAAIRALTCAQSEAVLSSGPQAR